MAYRRGNYDFVIDSSFQPFSMQEMLVPYMAYKQAFEESEKAYTELSNKADTFAYLSKELPEGSKARQIYEGYANELHKQAMDLASNGLNMSNRGALTGLKRRYQGEIGRLDLANTALQQEKALRRQMSTKDPSMLYAIDNMNIDDFLDNNTPNLYGISGNELYARGAAAGKATSSRMYSAGDEGSTLNGYYRKWVERNGVSQESIAAFMQSAEVQQQVDNIMEAQGVNENLTGTNRDRARQQILNGIYDGIVYQERVNPVRDPDVMSAAEKDASKRAWRADARAERSENMQAVLHGLKSDGKGGWVADKNSAFGIISRTNSGNPVYKDPTTKKPFAYGSDGVTKYYDNDGDGNYTDAYPLTKQQEKYQAQKTKDEQKQEAATKARIAKLDAAVQSIDLRKDIDAKNFFANNNGFDAKIRGGEIVHYDYAGAIAGHQGWGDKQLKWESGKLHTPNKAHWGPGFMSSTNVENEFGTYVADGYNMSEMKSGRRVRALKEAEIDALPNEVQDHIKKLIEDYQIEHNIDKQISYQVVAVPDESDSNGTSYLVAVENTYNKK
jgi:hypothetical protein